MLADNTYSDSRSGHNLSSSELLSRRVKRMTIEVSQEMHSRLKKAAAEEDRYIRDLVIDATQVYLDKHHPRVK
jgi:hypothetical protein